MDVVPDGVLGGQGQEVVVDVDHDGYTLLLEGVHDHDKVVAEDALKRVKFSDEALRDTFEANAQWAYELGFAREKPALDGLADLTILKRLQATK